MLRIEQHRGCGGVVVHDDKLVSTSPLTDSRYRLLNKVLDAAEESRTTFRPYFDDRESAWPRLPWTNLDDLTIAKGENKESVSVLAL
jgi:hypothetical protein